MMLLPLPQPGISNNIARRMFLQKQTETPARRFIISAWERTESELMLHQLMSQHNFTRFLRKLWQMRQQKSRHLRGGVHYREAQFLITAITQLCAFASLFSGILSVMGIYRQLRPR